MLTDFQGNLAKYLETESKLAKEGTFPGSFFTLIRMHEDTAILVKVLTRSDRNDLRGRWSINSKVYNTFCNMQDKGIHCAFQFPSGEYWEFNRRSFDDRFLLSGGFYLLSFREQASGNDQQTEADHETPDPDLQV